VGGATAADGNLATDAGFGAAARIDLKGGLMATMQKQQRRSKQRWKLTGTTIGGGGVQINTPSVVFSTTASAITRSKVTGAVF